MSGCRKRGRSADSTARSTSSGGRYRNLSRSTVASLITSWSSRPWGESAPRGPRTPAWLAGGLNHDHVSLTERDISRSARGLQDVCDSGERGPILVSQCRIFESVADRELESGDVHRVAEGDQGAAAGERNQLDAGSFLERRARPDDDERTPTERRQFRRSVRLSWKHRLNEADHRATQVGIDRSERADHARWQRECEGLRRRLELPRPSASRVQGCYRRRHFCEYIITNRPFL